MALEPLLNAIANTSESIEFADVIAAIEANYSYTPTEFKNGLGNSTVINREGTNEGSCKIFAFAQLHNLDEQQTLACFGDYYHKDVLQHPEGQDHQNIRNFMLNGWNGIEFTDKALTNKE